MQIFWYNDEAVVQLLAMDMDIMDGIQTQHSMATINWFHKTYTCLLVEGRKKLPELG